MKRFHVAVWLFIAISSALLAQEYRGRVQGTITDPSQAPVAGAKVNLRNLQTGTDNAAETDSTGKYRLDFVPPGNYSLTVESAGFSRATRDGVAVLTRGDVTLDVQLAIGNAPESVNVARVNNPFYNVLPIDKFPGNLQPLLSTAIEGGAQLPRRAQHDAGL